MNDMSEINALKASYEAAKKQENIASMLLNAGRLLSTSPTLAIAQMINNSLPANLPGRPAVSLRIAILRSYTVEPFVPLLKAFARLYGIDLTVKVGEFNSYAQEILDPSSWLYVFDPHIVTLAVQTRDIAPEIWNGSLEVSVDESSAVLDRVLSPLLSLIGQLRSRSSASLILSTLEQPQTESAGLLDSRRPMGQADLIRAMNNKIFAAARESEGAFVLDYDALVARHGRKRWTDEKKWLTSRAPISADCLPLIAQEYLRFIVPLAGRQSKVLVLDLDNTVWGGVIGEDGLNGIKIGAEYPGASYLELQRAALDISSRGVVLAICSKNNEADATEAFEQRKEMLLRMTHFAAKRINWIDKAQNLREIAAELNVGLDSLVFVDDNPVERERVKLELPEVTVVDLPADPTGYAAALRAVPVFERLTVTAEDRDRGRYYAEQRERKQLETSAGSLEDFYRSLEMSAEYVDVNAETIARIAQLTQKTNQLNMTTRRYTEVEVESVLQQHEWKLFGLKILDKFGDNGIVGVVFVNVQDNTAVIDNFLLSCRVIGRTVETVMLAKICEIAQDCGCRKVAGWFFPTKKNDPAKNIYSSHGFVIREERDGGILWELDLTEKSIVVPEWFD